MKEPVIRKDKVDCQKKLLLRLYSVDVKESLFKQGFYTLKVSEAS